MACGELKDCSEEEGILQRSRIFLTVGLRLYRFPRDLSR